jgi:hypothetical protein
VSTCDAMTSVERTGCARAKVPAAVATTRVRVSRTRLPRATLLVLGIAASGCTSESPSAASANTSGAADTVAGGTGAVAAPAGQAGGEASPGATGVSQPESGLSEGTGTIAGLAPADTTGDSSGAEASDGGAGAGGGVEPTTPSDAGEGSAPDEPGTIVLLDGTNLDEWRSLAGGDAGWELPGDGTLVIAPGSGNIVTRRTFEDLFVHVEYQTPAFPPNVTGQDRGNSGVYLNSMYELQVLDSFGLPPAIDGCGAVYGVSAPSSTACFAQEVWNTYEIEFQAARWDAAGNKVAQARVLSAQLNGVLIQEGVDIPDSTGSGEPEAPGPRPLMLQDHGNRVAFRNIWVIPR